MVALELNEKKLMVGVDESISIQPQWVHLCEMPFLTKTVPLMEIKTERGIASSL
jgi:hypothetical protein